MKKLAIFTEGQTEQLFSEYLIRHIAGDKQLSITIKIASGGSRNNPRRLVEIEAESNPNGAKYFVLIVNCGNDSRVKSDIVEQHTSLASSGYEKIIGIRDVFPDATHEELPKLRTGLEKGLNGKSPKILFILGVMELEAWFLSEYKHFPLIHENITPERISKELKIDVINDVLSQRREPSRDLLDAYWLESINYDKSKAIVDQILSVLNKENLKSHVSSKYDDLALFYQEIESFFSDSPI